MFTKSKSWPFGSGSVLWGIGMGFRFIFIEFSETEWFIKVGFLSRVVTIVDNRRNGKTLMVESELKAPTFVEQTVVSSDFGGSFIPFTVLSPRWVGELKSAFALLRFKSASFFFFFFSSSSFQVGNRHLGLNFVGFEGFGLELPYLLSKRRYF